MTDPETQIVTPEPDAASGVPSVNPEVHPVADSESQGTNWVDPLFLERADTPLPDEIVTAGSDEAAQAAAAETEDTSPSAEQLAKLIAEDIEAPGSSDPAGKPAQTAVQAQEEPAEGEDGGDAGSTAGSETGSDATDSTPQRLTRAERRKKAAAERRAARHTQREQARTIEVQGRAIQELQEQIKQDSPAGEAGAAAEAEADLPDEPPTLEDHNYDTEEWATAMGNWTKAKVGQAEQKAAKASETEAGKAAAARNHEIMEAFGERENTARELHEDYDDVVYDDTLTIPHGAAPVIWQSDNGPELAYYLATHQDEAKGMAEMSQVDLGRAIAKIEFNLTAGQAAPAQPAENTQAAAAEQAPANEPARQAQPAPAPTNAPPPVPTLGGSGAAVRPSPEKMSMDEYIAGRRSGKIR